jgi:uncharacterized protein DUF4230
MPDTDRQHDAREDQQATRQLERPADQPRRWRRGRLLGRGLGFAAGAVAGALVIILVGLGLVGLVPSLNPFGSDTVDRSQPALLQSIRDLSEYHAAVGDFQVVVDVERDVRFVPSVIAGERSLFVAKGTVDAYVDFGGLAGDALRVDEEAKTVEIRLPGAALAKPNLDPEASYLFDQQRGVVDRINDLITPPDQHELYVTAEQKIAEAAEASELKARAEQNTRAMLTGMLQSLGYQVSFGADDS